MNVLIINLARMGDLVQITPAAQGLKDETGAHIALLAPGKYAQFAERLAGVDEVLSLDDHLIPANGEQEIASILSRALQSEVIMGCRNRHFDVVINLTHDTYSTALASQFNARIVRGRFGADGNIQVRGDAFRYFYSVLEAREVNGINLCDLYRLGTGVRKGYRPVRMTPKPNDLFDIRNRIGATSRPLVVLHPGANHPNRRWSAVNFGVLASRLRKLGAEVLVLSGPGEQELALTVEQTSKGAARMIPGPLPVHLLPALLGLSDLLITNDTGPLHIAAAVGTPTLSIFLAMARPEDTAPFDVGHLIFETMEDCHPCPEQHVCNSPVCGNSIPFDVVAETALRKLSNEKIDDNLFTAASGRFRVLETTWGQTGMIEIREIYRSVEDSALGRSARHWKPVWLDLLNGKRPGEKSLQHVVHDFDAAEQHACEAMRQVGEAILARLDGSLLQDSEGNDVTISALEEMSLQIESLAGQAKQILLPFRLEREALYARGMQSLQKEAATRFRRWIDTLVALSPDVVRKEVAA